MPTFFRRKVDPKGKATKEPQFEAVREESKFYVPASVRPAEPQRFSLPQAEAGDVDETQDEDLAFLRVIAEQVEEGKATPAPRRRAVQRPGQYIVRDADDVAEQEARLRIFREAEAEREPPAVLKAMRIDDVELDDLLEQLATTAAALRRRRAA